MSSEALIRDLSADLPSVRRRSVLREATLLAGLGAAELALVLGSGTMRPDMSGMIGSPYMLWKLGGLACLALLAGATAVRSFSPPVSARGGLIALLAIAVVAALAGALPGWPGTHGISLIERLAPVHGMICSLCIIVLSLPPMVALGVLLRRGAPTQPRASALAAGAAAGLWGALVFALCCPANDPLYVVVWYSAACVIVAAIGRWLLPMGFRL